MATQADVRDLIARIRQTGYKVTKSGTKHHKILKPNGSVLVDENGPLIISATPSETRWREMTVRRLIGAGVFKDDPYKETRGKRGEADENGDAAADDKDEEKRKRREATAAAARARGVEFGTRTRDLRYRVERLIVHLGGWNTGHGTSVNGVSLADFMRLVKHWLEKHETKIKWPTDKGIPSSPAAASQALRTLRAPDATVGAKWLPVFEGFMDYLYAEDATDAEKAASRYRILVRETRGEVGTGVVRRSTPAEPGAGLAQQNGDAEEQQEQGPAHRDGVLEVPTLAMKALYHMARDPSAGASVIDIAHKIADLEMNSIEKRTRRV